MKMPIWPSIEWFVRTENPAPVCCAGQPGISISILKNATWSEIEQWIYRLDAGCRTILVSTGYAGRDGKHDITADAVCDDLKHAAEIIVAKELTIAQA
jgi:hypothetical protein